MVSPGGTSWYSAGWLFYVSMVTSLIWYAFWLVMGPVKLDVIELVNWYFFMKLNLSHQYDIYSIMESIHNWCPLVLILTYVLSRASLVYRDQLLKISQVIYVVMILYHIFFLFLLVFAGGMVLQLFYLTLPLYTLVQFGPFLSRFFSPSSLPLPTSFSVLLYFLICCRHTPSPPDNRVQRCNAICSFSLMGGVIKRILATFFLPFSLTLLTYLLMERGCGPCHSLPGFSVHKKPDLIGHRGCGFDAPENTIAAFERSSVIPEVVGLETDIYVSMDGVLYLNHDPHLARTSDVRIKCPAHVSLSNSSLLYYRNGSCPLSTLNVGGSFISGRSGGSGGGGKVLSQDEIRLFQTQKIPTFEEFLEVCKRNEMAVIFDVSEPPLHHPYYKTYLNKTLAAIIASGIPLNQVWWLPVKNRDWVYERYPEMIQTTKTKDTPFGDMKEAHIGKINDDWTTPLWLFRDYQAVNISLNMFFVDSPFMYSYAWCVGVQTVTTSNCKSISSISSNLFIEICKNWSVHRGYSHSALIGGLVVIVEIIAVVCWECYRITGHHLIRRGT